MSNAWPPGCPFWSFSFICFRIFYFFSLRIEFYLAVSHLRHNHGKSNRPREGAKNATEAILEGQTEKLPEAPEGSLKAYLAVVGTFTAMFVSFGWVNCIALFQAEYETNQLKQYTSSQVSWITSMECKISLQTITLRTK
jgi:hypothetical protein